MNQEIYQVESNGNFRTGKTTAGPVGAYHGLTGDKPREWKYIDTQTTIVNGHTVKKLNHIHLNCVRDVPH